MMQTQTQLQTMFATNFVAYYHTHVAHVNIMGRNFYSDHKLLGKIYEHLQGNIDTIAELIRTTGEFIPSTVSKVITGSEIDDMPMVGNDQDLLSSVNAHLVTLCEGYRELYKIATEQGYEEISNFAQDEMLALNKYVWMLDSTLLPEVDDEDEDSI